MWRQVGSCEAGGGGRRRRGLRVTLRWGLQTPQSSSWAVFLHRLGLSLGEGGRLSIKNYLGKIEGKCERQHEEIREAKEKLKRERGERNESERSESDRTEREAEGGRPPQS